MILQIDHVQITIPKGAEDAGRAFYCGILRLPEIPKPESLQGRGGFWLQVGDRPLHVGTEDGFDRRTTKSHVAYRVDDLKPWREVITNAGLTIEEQIPIPGYDRFEFRDPFGNRIELTQLV
jgi:catechol 2,3-dioxygenase-like lactoylglutathione lyase family enzyme